MSATAGPISLARFADAIKELTLPSLHAKAAELRNSMHHLRLSNNQLQPFADAGDGDCADAIKENEEVMERMQARVELLRAEVEGRGMPWAVEAEQEPVNGGAGDGGAGPGGGNGGGRGAAADARRGPAPGVYL